MPATDSGEKVDASETTGAVAEEAPNATRTCSSSAVKFSSDSEPQDGAGIPYIARVYWGLNYAKFSCLYKRHNFLDDLKLSKGNETFRMAFNELTTMDFQLDISSEEDENGDVSVSLSVDFGHSSYEPITLDVFGKKYILGRKTILTKMELRELGPENDADGDYFKDGKV